MNLNSYIEVLHEVLYLVYKNQFINWYWGIKCCWINEKKVVELLKVNLFICADYQLVYNSVRLDHMYIIRTHLANDKVMETRKPGKWWEKIEHAMSNRVLCMQCSGDGWASCKLQREDWLSLKMMIRKSKMEVVGQWEENTKKTLQVSRIDAMWFHIWRNGAAFPHLTRRKQPHVPPSAYVDNCFFLVLCYFFFLSLLFSGYISNHFPNL